MGLRDIRKAQGLTLKALSQKSKVHYMKIQQIEVGRIKPENMTLKTAARLADALGCDPRNFLE